MILNIEEDHMDFFHDLSDIRHSFHLFAKRIPEHGTLIINADISKIAVSNFFAICSNMLTFHKHSPFHKLSITACEYKREYNRR